MVPHLKTEAKASSTSKIRDRFIMKLFNDAPQWPEDEDHATGGRES